VEVEDCCGMGDGEDRCRWSGDYDPVRGQAQDHCGSVAGGVVQSLGRYGGSEMGIMVERLVASAVFGRMVLYISTVRLRIFRDSLCPSAMLCKV